MKLVVATLALVALAAPTQAQSKGSLALDATTAAGRHLGVGYYVTDGLSVRPGIALSYSDRYGASLDLGLDVRWELLTQRRLSPYATAGVSYQRGASVGSVDPVYGAQADSDLLRYGGGGGLRARIARGFSAVAEGRVMSSALRTVSGAAGYGSLQVAEPGARFEAVVGLSYVFQ
jgi:hypothetical protein